VDAPRATRMPVTGTWLRHIPAGSDPLYRPPTPADGRWQRGARIEGIYLAAEEATVWADTGGSRSSRSSHCVDCRGGCPVRRAE